MAAADTGLADIVDSALYCAVPAALRPCPGVHVATRVTRMLIAAHLVVR